MPYAIFPIREKKHPLLQKVLVCFPCVLIDEVFWLCSESHTGCINAWYMYPVMNSGLDKLQRDLPQSELTSIMHAYLNSIPSQVHYSYGKCTVYPSMPGEIPSRTPYCSCVNFCLRTIYRGVRCLLRNACLQWSRTLESNGQEKLGTR